MNTMTPPLTEKQLSELWGVSMYTLARLRDRGEISHTRISGRVRYTEKHIREYLESGESSKPRKASGR